MGVFDDILHSDQSLIINEGALEPEYVPKMLPFREGEQRHLATCIAPLLQHRNGRNAFVHGAPGIGKTAAARHVLRDLEEQTEDIHVVYVNCWQHNSTFKALVAICDELGYRFTQNKKTTDLFRIVAKIVNEKSAVFVFDEVDKAEEYDFLYSILEQVYRKSVVLITNYKSFLLEVDERIKSRLTPEVVEFRPYTPEETEAILRERVTLAFRPGTFAPDAFSAVAAKAAEVKDIRAGLFLLREAALQAEAKSSKTVSLPHVEAAVAKLDEFTVKNASELEDEVKFILDIVKAHSGLRIGDLYRKYEKEGGKASYKTFQRKLARLDQNAFITLKKQTGAGGNTTIVEKKLTDY